MWVKCWEYTEEELFGKLFNEPKQNFGIHRKYIIGFAPIKHEDKIFCAYTDRYLQGLENQKQFYRLFDYRKNKANKLHK